MLPFQNRYGVHTGFFLTIAVLSILSAPLHARRFTVDQAIDRALDEDLDRAVVRHKLQAWRQKSERTGQWKNPTLSASKASDGPTNDRGKEVLSLELSQPFPVTERLHQQRTIGRLEWKQALAELRDYDRNLILDVKTTYSSLVHNNRILSVYDHQIERLNTIIELGQSFLDRGELSRLELNMMKMERDMVKKRRDRIKQQLLDARGSMKNLLNLSGDEEFRVSATPDQLKTEVAQSVDTSVRPARPDLRKRKLALEQLQSELQREQSQAWDDWIVSMGYDREQTIGGGKEKTLSLGVAVPFPIWNQNSAMRAFKEHMIQSAQISVQALRRTIDRRIATLREKLTLQQETIRRYNETVLPRARKQEELSRQGFERGRVKPSEFLRINAQLFDARRAYYRERQELTELYVRYQHITGTSNHLKTDFLKERSQ